MVNRKEPGNGRAAFGATAPGRTDHAGATGAGRLRVPISNSDGRHWKFRLAVQSRVPN